MSIRRGDIVPRYLAKKLQVLKNQYPVIAVFGPRQSGKTTLVKSCFCEYAYVNLESFTEREFAHEDPKGFLARFKDERGVILDEIQKVPELLSHIQVEVDELDPIGRYIITGSQNILLNHHVNESLAGRVAFLTLLPFSIRELAGEEKLPSTIEEAIFRGFYPRVHKRDLDPVLFSESYIQSYVEKDVRDLLQITSLFDFQKFLRLLAARVGQLLDLSELSRDAGISLTTVKSWLSVLETSYIIFLLWPHHRNFNKRIVKMPKLYFYDTALVCNLLRIFNHQDLYVHYLRGSLFESMIISDFLKKQYHDALPPHAYFWRDKTGREVDLLLEEGSRLVPFEITSNATLQKSMFEGLKSWCEIADVSPKNGSVIYAGSQTIQREYGKALSWKDL